MVFHQRASPNRPTHESSNEQNHAIDLAVLPTYEQRPFPHTNHPDQRPRQQEQPQPQQTEQQQQRPEQQPTESRDPKSAEERLKDIEDAKAALRTRVALRKAASKQASCP